MGNTLIAQLNNPAMLQQLNQWSFMIHELIFFFFLCFLPLGKHFHVITSLFNVYFMKLEKGTVKPVRWDVSDERLDDLEPFHTEDLTDGAVVARLAETLLADWREHRTGKPPP